MNSFIFGLVPFFGWALGDIFGAFASRKIGAYATTIWVFIGSFVVLTVYAFFVGFAQLITGITLPLFLLNLLLGFFYVSGNFALNEAFTKTNPSLAGTINAAFPALVLVLSVLFFKDPITLPHILVITIIFAGVFLCTFDFGILKSKAKVVNSGLFFALYAMVSFAVVFTFLRVITDKIGWFWPIYISLFPSLIFLGMMRIKKIPLVSPLKTKTLLPILGSTISLRIGDIIFNLGLHSGLAKIVAPIAGAYPVLFVILAFFVFKDPIKKQQMIGIVVTLLGIVLLSIISV
ncbi:MAG: Integral membrane protein [Candidatus Gottesmanbacteria bacterium GW2011_GWB1_43_11]|uniref:Integral membrane protein n=1 Tax=Candidatus Gottesmanbacteria bacterium GW2011_GWB1_43_11 TaxID=1618446 RepID=A0A0G1CM94_9BACT|nr:MAG: Integral membrane protein [Candidatus Gottesmanbacteria bacterium GW2011_GWA2_42_16]KKS55714.1 MAG: Integral membrane protein [Candidatus Gottesmanbacteria bacterium GW2011_GWA1_42_26]KKS81170.1 MAG: Integral membrane protein [Candidatus Gottesmanbacteria bacterium GW2011_GWC1_43_10]KKS86900.1 MAG: Integral membrane protein [Candidatus Gottesmanbacteria bacterium GW2011_GWB1_43_11]OGG08247.1 MAG: hypothetical protein A2699_06630 [Candidatus Gottesmanbacteria bacterium RIFCSPHIGHO2_01_FU